MTEALTTDAVSAVLRARLDAAATCRHLHRGAVGNGQETWFVTAGLPDGDRDLVLRRTAVGGPLEWTDRRAEAEVMNLVADHGLPVPRVLWVADEDSELDRPYLVMERASGGPAGRGGDRDAQAADLARWLARLHAAGVAAPDGPADAGEATAHQVSLWRTTFRRRRPAPWPLVDALLACLEQELPAAVAGAPSVLVWGDAGLHNALAEAGEVTALLDWELAHAGHPLEDLAAAVWMELDGPVDVGRVVDAYASAAGSDVPAALLDRFVALVCVTRAIMILGAGTSYATGRTHVPSLAGLALDLPVHQLGRAARLLGWEQVASPPPPVASVPAGPRPHPGEVDRGVAAHLREDVLPRLDDRHTRRGLRTAIALLETSAHRVELDAWARERDARRTAALRSHLAEVDGDLDDLGEAVARVEREPGLADLRPTVRRLLLEDLADRRVLLAPLADLYRPDPTS